MPSSKSETGLPYEMIFLDRDGTLNPDPGYIARLDDFRFYDFTLSALQILARQGYRFCIVTNQSGIARDLINPDDLEKIHEYIRGEFQRHQIPLEGIFVCPDHPDQAGEDRKPGPGMFKRAAREFGLDLQRCLMIGDSQKDIIAGHNLDMDTLLVLTGEGRRTAASLPDDQQPRFIAADLMEASHKIMEIQA